MLLHFTCAHAKDVDHQAWNKRNQHFLNFIKAIPDQFIQNRLSIILDCCYDDPTELYSLFKWGRTKVTLKSLDVDSRSQINYYTKEESLTIRNIYFNDYDGLVISKNEIKILNLDEVYLSNKKTFTKFKCLEKLSLKNVDHDSPKKIKFHKDAKLKFLELGIKFMLDSDEILKIFK